jgi:hypothetical protein
MLMMALERLSHPDSQIASAAVLTPGPRRPRPGASYHFPLLNSDPLLAPCTWHYLRACAPPHLSRLDCRAAWSFFLFLRGRAAATCLRAGSM